jgi:hypothetical protein
MTKRIKLVPEEKARELIDLGQLKDLLDDRPPFAQFENVESLVAHFATDLIKAIAEERCSPNAFPLLYTLLEELSCPYSLNALWHRLYDKTYDGLRSIDLAFLDPRRDGRLQKQLRQLMMDCIPDDPISIRQLYMLSSAYERSLFFQTKIKKQFIWFLRDSDVVDLLKPGDNMAFIYWQMLNQGNGCRMPILLRQDLWQAYWYLVMRKSESIVPLDPEELCIAISHLFSPAHYALINEPVERQYLADIRKHHPNFLEYPQGRVLLALLRRANTGFKRALEPWPDNIGLLDQLKSFSWLCVYLGIAFGCDVPIFEALHSSLFSK